MANDTDSYKKTAAERGAELVESGMVVGLGHGSTALFAVRRLAARLGSGELRDIIGVPCSRFMAEEARRLRIRLTTLEHHPAVDMTIDGADEVDPNLNLIKGGGGALLREKIVAQASAREVIVVDEAKISPALGTKWAVPVEVFEFGWRPTMEALSNLGAEVTLRVTEDGKPFQTDHGNLILDANFGPIEDVASLAARLDALAAVAGHGLFLGIATDVIVAGPSGVQHLTKK
ncbi:MAG: ribose 5-phosphate isomerase A [Gemmatimonadota bacterium]|nr:MAG: ribose 5-phosphate isomerase A [Gemmatimonadota bacterium]